MSATEVIDLCDMRFDLERGVARQICYEMDDHTDEIAKLHRSAKQLDSLLPEISTADIVAADEHFFRSLAHLAGNHERSKSLSTLASRLQFFTRIYLDNSTSASACVKNHIKICTSLQDKDLARVEEILSTRLVTPEAARTHINSALALIFENEIT